MIDAGLSRLLNLSVGAGLDVTTDIDLLPVVSTSHQDVDAAIVLVAGTGSVCMSFKKTNGRFVRTSRAGGWGYLLGDDGSGYGIGREALRLALRASDVYRMRKDAGVAPQALPPFADAIFKHFQEQFPDAKPEDLLSTVMVPNSTSQQAGDAVMDRTSRIAGVAKAVLAMAETDTDAHRIVKSGAGSLAELAAELALSQSIEPSRANLVLAGGLMQDSAYRGRIVDALKKAGHHFQNIEVVDHPAMNGARFLSESMGKH